MKIKLKYVASALLSVAVLAAVLVHLAPVSFDGSGPGFEKWIADQYTVKLFRTYLEESGYAINSNVQLISTAEEIQQQIQMDKRNIYLRFRVRVEGTERQVQFEGRRYWIERYNWHLKNN